ncbi:MAG TPA: hydantoinase B/oxoprolinase family protein, partial [Acetobacteraceae bacterium]|nr:hydantoinase B/oxoprolinase family protein [Acetobacteraceae bacterium]
MDVDPITLEVLRNKLDGIANEMQLTLVRSAFSAIVKEGLDASASLFTLQGETLAQALAIPVHLGALTPMVGRLLQDVPLETMGEGDIWILNDTYMG